MPVPGTMTAVWWETLMDPSLVFGIPQVGMKDNQGRILENMQLEPDIKVTNDPASAMKGRDLQLEAAVESLMKEINNQVPTDKTVTRVIAIMLSVVTVFLFYRY